MGQFFCCMNILVAYPGHVGVFIRYIAVLFFLQNQNLGEVLSSQIDRKPQKKVVVRLLCSTRQLNCPNKPLA